jgi:hypothetical protein
LLLLFLYAIFRQPARLAASIVALDRVTFLSGLFTLTFILFMEFYAIIGIYYAVKAPQLLSALAFYLLQRFNWKMMPYSWQIAIQCIICFHQWIFIHAVFLFVSKYTVNQLYVKYLQDLNSRPGSQNLSFLKNLQRQTSTLSIYAYVLSSTGLVIFYSLAAPFGTFIRLVGYYSPKASEKTARFTIYSYPGLISLVMHQHIDSLAAPAQMQPSSMSEKRARLDSTTSSALQVQPLSSNCLFHRLELFMLFSAVLFICNPFIIFYQAVYLLAVPFLSMAIFLSCLAFASENFQSHFVSNQI